MDFLASPFGVLIILAAVTIAAFSFQPDKYIGAWKGVAELYETELRPASTAFSDEAVSLGRDQLTRIDAAITDEGFWMVYNGPDPRAAPACTLIPWDCIRYKADKGSRKHFQIRVNGPLDFFVSAELGNALQRRAQSMPPGVE